MRFITTFLLVVIGACSCSAFLFQRTTPTTRKPVGPIVFTTITKKPTEKPPAETPKTPEPVTASTTADTPRAETNPPAEVTVTDAAIDTATPEPATDKATDAVTEPVTDAATEPATDAATEPATDVATDAVTESTVTDKSTEKPTRAIPRDDTTPSGVCGTCKDNGNGFTVVENSGCSLFRLQSDQGGKPQACPRGTKFDVNLCVCNFEYDVKCDC